MSGGFFRGTSTDQDTRFSNKKAKLLKSQKFASELETLVDMTRVKMDVMRPWIAKRVTELIGFEDEVLINFIYGLLEGKEVNGKEVQISLTGFMERNTGMFMKELWLLLLSAQQNVSGVPQQFLDAKEEETKKKKTEADRIASEIQRKKEEEKQELECERLQKDSDDEKLKDKLADLEQNPLSNNQQVYEKKHAYAPSSERGRSRSVSRSPPRSGRSISSERRYPTPKRFVSPRRKHVQLSPSPPRRRSSRSKRRSLSPRSRRRSPSPLRYKERFPRRYGSRSPLRCRSRSLRGRSRTPVQTSSLHRRSPSPHRRSPSSSRYRSPSPPRRRRSPSPVWRRSPSLVNRGSPSPVRHISPPFIRRRSPSLSSGRSQSPRYHRRRSPLQRKPPSHCRLSPTYPVSRRYHRSPSTSRRSVSPGHLKSHMLGGKGSFTRASQQTPQKLSSSPLNRHTSISPIRKESSERMRSPSPSPAERVSREKQSPVHRFSTSERADLPANNQNVPRRLEQRPIISLRSPQKDSLDQDDLHGKKSSPSPSKKNSPSEYASRERGYDEALRPSSPDNLNRKERISHPQIPPRPKASGIKSRRASSETSDDDLVITEMRNKSAEKNSPTIDQHNNSINSARSRVSDECAKSRKSQLSRSGRDPDRLNYREHQEKLEQSAAYKTSARSEKEMELYSEEAGNKNIARSDNGKGSNLMHKPEVLPVSLQNFQLNGRKGSSDSPSKKIDDYKTERKRKHKKSHKHEIESDDYTSDDSYEERKELKCRRKEEKKLKREEKCRRRDEQHRRKEERRAEKQKLNSGDSGNPSEIERHSESDNDQRRGLGKSDSQEMMKSAQDLEMKLREKALESLRARRGIDNSKK